MTKETIREAVLRGFRRESNGSLRSNLDTIEAIVDEVWQVDLTPTLGNASTIQLVSELDARTRTAALAGEGWPHYRTVDAV